MDKCKTRIFNPAELLAQLDLGKTRMLYVAPMPDERTPHKPRLAVPPPLPVTSSTLAIASAKAQPLQPTAAAVQPSAAALRPSEPCKTRVLPLIPLDTLVPNEPVELPAPVPACTPLQAPTKTSKTSPSPLRRALRLAILGVTLLMLATVAWEKLAASAAPEAEQRPQPTAASPTPAPQPVQHKDIGAGTVRGPAPLPPPAQPGRPVELAATGRMARLATDALATGDLARAAGAYRKLATREPQNPVYAEAARILEARAAPARAAQEAHPL